MGPAFLDTGLETDDALGRIITPFEPMVSPRGFIVRSWTKARVHTQRHSVLREETRRERVQAQEGAPAARGRRARPQGTELDAQSLAGPIVGLVSLCSVFKDKTIKLWKITERDKRPEGYNLKDEEGKLKDLSTVTSLQVSCRTRKVPASGRHIHVSLLSKDARTCGALAV